MISNSVKHLSGNVIVEVPSFLCKFLRKVSTSLYKNPWTIYDT